MPTTCRRTPLRRMAKKWASPCLLPTQFRNSKYRPATTTQRTVVELAANVDVISRTGTDHFHGTAWEFLRNDLLNANNFFSKLTGQPRPVLKQNQFGATLGGPIWRGRTFFFGAYQGLRSSNGGAIQ